MSSFIYFEYFSVCAAHRNKVQCVKQFGREVLI